MEKKHKNSISKVLTSVIIILLLILVIVYIVKFGNKNNNGTDSQAVSLQLSDIKITDKDHILNDQDTKTTIVEYSDFECPYCGKFYLTLKQIADKYPNDVRIVYKHFPLSSIHPFASQAANASECASEQGEFWDYADQLFANQDSFNSDYFFTLASKLNLNTDQFNSCLKDKKYSQKVQNDYNEGLKLGVSGTPTIFINEQKMVGAVPFEQIDQAIQQDLKYAQ